MAHRYDDRRNRDEMDDRYRQDRRTEAGWDDDSEPRHGGSRDDESRWGGGMWGGGGRMQGEMGRRPGGYNDQYRRDSGSDFGRWQSGQGYGRQGEHGQQQGHAGYGGRHHEDDWRQTGSGGYGQAPYEEPGGRGYRQRGQYGGQYGGQQGHGGQGGGQYGGHDESMGGPYAYGQGGGSEHELSYRNWRDRQNRTFDEDYQAFNAERQKRFDSEFDEWRKSRAGQDDRQSRQMSDQDSSFASGQQPRSMLSGQQGAQKSDETSPKKP